MTGNESTEGENDAGTTGSDSGATGSDHVPSQAAPGDATAGTAAPTEAAVRERLERGLDPCSEANGTDLHVLEMGLLGGIEIDDRRVTVDLRLTSPHCMMVPFFVERIGEEVGALPAVETVEVTHDAGLSWTPEMIAESGREKRERAQSHLATRRPRRAAPRTDGSAAVDGGD